jgi:hypothetical protein
MMIEQLISGIHAQAEWRGVSFGDTLLHGVVIEAWVGSSINKDSAGQIVG